MWSAVFSKERQKCQDILLNNFLPRIRLRARLRRDGWTRMTRMTKGRETSVAVVGQTLAPTCMPSRKSPGRPKAGALARARLFSLRDFIVATSLPACRRAKRFGVRRPGAVFFGVNIQYQMLPTKTRKEAKSSPPLF